MEVASLTLSGNGIIKGAGTVAVTGTFTWSGPGTLEGAGTTSILPGASANINSTPGEVHLKGRRLVNEGTVTQTAGMHFRNGSELINSGTYNANAPGSPLITTGRVPRCTTSSPPS